MRLRNRMLNGRYWTSGDLARWHRDKRAFYHSLWACAEDSCCIEDDMFEVKITAWASPMDADMTVELFEQWRDELVESKKLVPYEVDGRRYFYIPGMARNEHPRNPQEPDIPMPPWVTYIVTGSGRGKRVTYTHSFEAVTVQTHGGSGITTVQAAPGDRTASPVQSSPVQSSPERESSARAAFPDAWSAYPLHRYRDRAEAAFAHAIEEGASEDEIVAACRASPRKTDQSLEYFIADGTWRDYVPHQKRPTCETCGGNRWVIHPDRDEAVACPDCAQVAVTS